MRMVRELSCLLLAFGRFRVSFSRFRSVSRLGRTDNAFVDALENHPPLEKTLEGLVEGAAGAAEQAGVEVGSMILSVNGESVLGKGVEGVGVAVKRATAAGEDVVLELAALRTTPPAAKAAWGQAEGQAEQGEQEEEGKGDVGVAVGTPPPATSKQQARKQRKAAAAKRNSKQDGHSAKPDSGGGDASGGKGGRCELCRCSAKQAIANAKDRGPGEITSNQRNISDRTLCSEIDCLRLQRLSRRSRPASARATAATCVCSFLCATSKISFLKSKDLGFTFAHFCAVASGAVLR